MGEGSFFRFVIIFGIIIFCSIADGEKASFESAQQGNSFKKRFKDAAAVEVFEMEASNKEDEVGSGSLDPDITTDSTSSYSLPTTHIPDEILKRIEDQPGVNSAIDAILVLVVIQTMLGLGCTMDVHLIKEHLYQPSGIAIAAACQFGFMPFIAFLMAKIFALDKVAALAVLVTGCCPGGNLSNLLTYFLYGDMNLSILMSTTSTILALILMPFCLFVYGSGWIEMSIIGKMIPFGGVVLSLFLTLIPVGAGIAIKARFEKFANTLLKISLFSVLVSFVALMTLSIILLGSSLFSAISGASYAIAIIMPLIGYGSGYLLATGFRLPDASRRTVAIETGCQNSQLSSTILKMAFTTQTMGAYFLFPIYYALFQGLEGLVMIVAFRAYRRYYADDVIVPSSRITYDKFDDENDGEDMQRYQGLCASSHSSNDSFHGKGDFKNTYKPEIPNSLPLNNETISDNKFQGQPKQKAAADKTALISQNQPFASNYGGIEWD